MLSAELICSRTCIIELHVRTPLKGGREGQPERCEPVDGKHRGDPRVARVAPATLDLVREMKESRGKSAATWIWLM